MANVRCPHCGKSNPSKLEICKYCGMELRQEVGPVMPDPQDPASNENGQVKNPPFGTDEYISKEQESIAENGSSPSWLKSVLDGKKTEARKSKSGSSEKGNPSHSSDPLINEPLDGGSSDLLAGFEKLTSDEEKTPAWFTGLTEGKDKKQSSALKQAKESTQAESPQKETPSSTGDDRSPDWVKSMETPLKVEEPKISPSGTEEKLPEWLKVSPDYIRQGKAPAVTSQEVQTGEVMPDWVSGEKGDGSESGAIHHERPDEIEFSRESPSHDEISSQPAAPAEGSGGQTPIQSVGLKNEVEAQGSENTSETPSITPDWMAEFGSGPGTPTSSPGESVPDWLSDLESKPGAEVGKTSAFFSTEELSEQIAGGEMPDWLATMQAEASVSFDEQAKGDIDEGVVAPFAEGTEPSLLEEPVIESKPSKRVPVNQPQGEETAPPKGENAYSSEMPDWLSNLEPENAEAKGMAADAESTDSGEINTSSLPSWVQAMRPVEAVVPEGADQGLERSTTEVKNGPLAGISGVLPVEPGLGQLKKPPAYSVKLQLSEAQQKYAAFLEQMVSEEAQPRQVTSRQGRTNRILRWAISVVLLLTLGIPLLTGAQITPVATTPPSDNDSAKTLVDAIPPHSAVLIAFDYDPALSGEMATVAAPLIDQLQEKGILLTLISTSPTGPALAEQFLQSTPLVNTHLYLAGVDYVNLGYLAGGLTGIYAFAANPEKIAPFDFSGIPAWGLTPLQGIHSLQDFKAVMVITDNGDGARSWIEQTSTQLGSTPLIMVTSAQAGPLVRPYFESGQVKGIVSGLVDAKIYEQEYGRPGLAAHFWSAYSLGIVAAEGLMGIGALVSLITALQRRRIKQGEEA